MSALRTVIFMQYRHVLNLCIYCYLNSGNASSLFRVLNKLVYCEVQEVITKLRCASMAAAGWVQGEGDGADHEAVRVAHRHGQRPHGDHVERQGVGHRPTFRPPGRHLLLRLRRRRGRLLLCQPHHLRGTYVRARRRALPTCVIGFIL